MQWYENMNNEGAVYYLTPEEVMEYEAVLDMDLRAITTEEALALEL